MSQTEINFLDTTVFKVDNKLRTKVYVKPTGRQSYLINFLDTTVFKVDNKL